MPTSLTCSEHISSLKNELRERYSDNAYAHRKVVYRDVFAEQEDVLPVLKTAMALSSFLQQKEIFVSENDLLAGNGQFYDYETPISKDAIPINPEEELLMERFNRGYSIGLFCGALGGHVIAGYHRVLSSGFGGMTEAAAEMFQSCSKEQRDFCEASRIVCQAASEYAVRYAQEAEAQMQHASSSEHAGNLQRIADSCAWIATNPPRTFHEALQLLWITHEIITIEQRSGSLSLGRLDQTLGPYYERDIAAGRITKDEAQDLVDALWVKFAGLKRGFQNVTVGGSDGRGSDLTNDLSYMFLRATRRLRMDQPLLSVRYHRDMPEDFWAEIQDLIGEGMGFPALFNEQLVAEAKIRVGVDPDDAVQWGIVGCVEPSIPGKEFSHTEGIRVNWAKVLELMLNDGRCATTGELFELSEPNNLEDVESFRSFYSWYRRELSEAIDLAIRGMNILDRDFSNVSPYPFLSSTMEGCLDAGKDVTAGSTVYNLCTVNGLGMANVADSLVAIQHAVFEKQRCSLQELATALQENFSANEPLRRELMEYPSYGNDQRDPDTILSQLCEDFCTTVESYRNSRGGRMQCGLYTVDSHGPVGEKTGAMPDGRLRGVALANALSPVQGSDVTGPTAVIKSCTKVHHLKAGNGMVLDLKFSPDFFGQIKKQGNFKSLVDTYFDRHGMEIQFNVIARETLEKAKHHPEEFENLVVRVSGFSAYFVDLPNVVQDEIIARTEYSAL